MVSEKDEIDSMDFYILNVYVVFLPQPRKEHLYNSDPIKAKVIFIIMRVFLFL